MKMGRLAQNRAFVGRRLRSVRRGRVLSGAWRPAGVILLTTFVTLALALLLAATIDVPAAMWARRLDGSVRHFFGVITRYGKSDWLLISTAIICLILLVCDWTRTSRLVAAAWSQVGFIAAFLFFAVAASGISVNIIKQVIGRARPRLLPAEGPLSFDPLAFQSVFQGFPSGHAQVMGALAMTAFLVTPRYAVIVLIPCLMVAASRVIISAHYVSDVLAGWVFGAGFTLLYAVAFAQAGVGFYRRSDGMVLARTGAIRAAGFGRMFAGLWSALFRGPRPALARRGDAVEPRVEVGD
jgi:undecaprenyl-diphosphatase